MESGKAPPDVPQFSLVFVHDPARGQLLLGLKKRGFATGKWNGFGGKLEVGESMRECAVRELQEESCLKAEKLDHVGSATIRREGIRSDTIQMDIFLFTEWSGEPTETEEMTPRWFTYNDETSNVPFPDMWAEAAIYLPLIILQRKRVDMNLFYTDWDGQGGQLHRHIIHEL